MKLLPPPTDRIRGRRIREHASAALIVLVLMMIMATLVISNSATLYHFKQELRLIERKQLKKYTRAGSPHAMDKDLKRRAIIPTHGPALTNAAYMPTP